MSLLAAAFFVGAPLPSALVAGALLGAAPAAAQEARVELARAPYYQGQPIELHVIATQFESSPQPEVEFDPQPALAIRLVGVSPSSSTSISIVNGQMTRVHEVSFTYRYELTSSRTGELLVPAFRVRQGATVRTTRSFTIDVAAVPSSDEFGVSLVLPEGPIFVGQRVPLAIEVRIDEAAAPDILDYRIQIPLFDVPGVRFVDTAPPGASETLSIATAGGVVQLRATSGTRRVGGRSMIVLRAERTLIPQRSGRIEAAAPTIAVERGTRFRQDFFGGRRAVATTRTLSSGRPVRVEVAALPEEGRPASFAGAVGTGFSLEVTADRSVVQLGEPIELTFHLRGHGDLASAGLPPLDAPGLFDPTAFRLPDEEPAGLVDEDGKHFRVTVRVLDARVRAIPALAYSWFDADSRRFETTHSLPIALSVGAAEVVGADAVTSAAAEGGDASAAEARRSGAAAGEAGGEAADGAERDAVRAGSLAESAANLAIERDADVLLGQARSTRGLGIATASLYALGLALLAWGVVERRRRAIDPVVHARRVALARAKRAIEGASAASGDADAARAAAIGRALRELVAAEPALASAELDAIVAECDALRFAPAGSAGAATSALGSLAQRARALVEVRLDALRSGTAPRVGGARLLLGLGLGGLSALGFAALAGPASAAVAPADGAPTAGSAAATLQTPPADDDARAQLARAIADYEAAQSERDRDARIAGFQRAARAFGALLDAGAASAALYTNLGHAALQAGRTGEAVLAYRRALALDPRAAAARQNLVHVRARLPAWVPRPGGQDGAQDVLFAYRRLPAPVRALAGAACFALAAFALVLSARGRTGPWRGAALLASALWLVLLASVLLDGRRPGEGTAAVLTSDETPARVSDSALAPLAFPEPLPAGVEVERLEVRGDFARIRLANGRDVWVRSSSVTPVAD
ncbi:MAG: BatD family protein [Myxococcota bacterium]